MRWKSALVTTGGAKRRERSWGSFMLCLLGEALNEREESKSRQREERWPVWCSVVGS